MKHDHLNNTNQSANILFSTIHAFKQQLKQKVHEYGDFLFDDDIWYCEKKHTYVGNKSKFTLNFNPIPDEYKDLMKYYALMQEGVVQSTTQKIISMRYFINYLIQYFPNHKLKNINKKIINHFEFYLKQNFKTTTLMLRIYSHVKDFFDTLCGVFPDVPDISPVKKRTPFKRNFNKDPKKYIPTYVVKQFDRIMLDETNDIPLVLRTAYWLQRSFPNRISEVCSIETNCIKSLYDMYILNIPTWKQNGGHLLPEIKTIPILNSGHGKYIIELIQRLKKQNEQSMSKLPISKNDTNYLLITPAISFQIKNNKPVIYSHAYQYLKIVELRKLYPTLTFTELSKKLAEIGINKASNSISHRLLYGLHDQFLRLRPLTSTNFNGYLEKLANVFKITDEDGKIYKPSSHQFRHNASTDRLYIGGYTIDQLRTIRNDKGENMPLHYAHQQKEMHKKMWMDSIGLISPVDAPVEFKGKIMNFNDKKKIDILSKRPQMYLTWEANSQKGVGLCSMIQGCKPSGTSVHFECYECNWFIPKAEYYEDYKTERKYWVQIMETCSEDPKRIATFENAIRNVNILDRIIEICENGIEKYKEHIQSQNNDGVDKLI
ncbi:integrase [Bacillus wiedmannii]|uniref:integrase n=1 Tax=Bacillus wiedmannii TaxID=1890302 RepID=UPI001CC155F8|nr:integrase [Bacillus wiedmannii]MBZ4222598.1 integrase [Bacillus wiedmannii]